jgi:putative endonuclease
MPARASPDRADSGRRAEAAAALHLERHGLSIVARNFRRRLGEVDLIARDGDTLVFVEVRLRRRDDYGGAAASIGAAKRARLAKAASLYLASLGEQPPCRFDAILLSELDPPRIEWLRNVID